MPSTLTVLFMGRTLRYSSLTLSFSLMRLAVLRVGRAGQLGLLSAGEDDNLRERAVDRSMAPAAAQVLICDERESARERSRWSRADEQWSAGERESSASASTAKRRRRLTMSMRKKVAFTPFNLVVAEGVDLYEMSRERGPSRSLSNSFDSP
jgi:hypothetical protein